MWLKDMGILLSGASELGEGQEQREASRNGDKDQATADSFLNSHHASTKQKHSINPPAKLEVDRNIIPEPLRIRKESEESHPMPKHELLTTKGKAHHLALEIHCLPRAYLCYLLVVCAWASDFPSLDFHFQTSVVPSPGGWAQAVWKR